METISADIFTQANSVFSALVIAGNNYNEIIGQGVNVQDVWAQESEGDLVGFREIELPGRSDKGVGAIIRTASGNKTCRLWPPIGPEDTRNN